MTVDGPVRALRSTVDASDGAGTVAIAIEEDEIRGLGEEHVVVRVEASPINPSDLGALLAGADPKTLRAGERGGAQVLLADLSAAAFDAQRARHGVPLPVGNEGAGVVVEAGSAPAAQALLGRTVAVIPGGMYATHRVVHHSQCLPMPDGVSAEQAASAFVNPLTVLGMIETMRLEGHSAIVHTAAASNLGQMLVKACDAEDVPLVNIVRRDEQVELLRSLGARFVVNSSAASFRTDLVEAVRETGATIVFDAIGGGDLVSTVMTAMERAMANDDPANRYGSTTLKQAYIYGGLDRGPTVLDRTYGMAWSIGGWLMPNFLARVGEARADELRAKVASEITTTFASSYSHRIGLDEALAPDVATRYARMATGDKYLITP